MIIETAYTKNDIITIKTTAGEEVVGRFVEEDSTTITIGKPLALVATQQGVGLGPFGFTIPQNSKLKLNKSGLLFVHKTEAEMSKQYVQNTTGIAL